MHFENDRLLIVGPTLLNQCGYIEQNELYIGSMTVREHLTFQVSSRCSRLAWKNDGFEN